VIGDHDGEAGDQATGEKADVAEGRDRTLEGIVATDFASTALRQASVASLVVAAAGVVVWGVTTYLQWHQFHQQGFSASQQALGALEPFSILLFAAVLGLVGFGCRLASNWIGLRLRSEYLEAAGSDEDESLGDAR
jgi:hypothetical protein